MKACNKIYNIYFDREIGSVVMEWEGYATSNQFREGTELMLNTLIKNSASKVLADIRNMVLIGAEDQVWVNTVFLPRATSFGFKSLAIIKPHHYFNHVAVESITANADKDKIIINFFENSAGAKTWLKNLDCCT